MTPARLLVASVVPHRRGHSRTKRRGQHMGQPPLLTNPQKAEARRRRAEGAPPGQDGREGPAQRSERPENATCLGC